MKANKTTALATFGIEVLREHVDGGLWEVLACLFNHFVTSSYPLRLNSMLLMPLHKKGDVRACDNYRGISLMHPLGRLFSKVVVARLERSPAATRAECQAGFRSRYRLEDNCLILQTAFELARA